MGIRQIWIPHGKKLAVKDLPPGADPSNPPLSREGRQAAIELILDLAETHGKPIAIFSSPRIRAMGTAAGAVETFGGMTGNAIPILTLNMLGQPENADHDPENPSARPDGFVIYGPESFDQDWLNWVEMSRKIIAATAELISPNGDGDVWIFAHRPIVAAARWRARHNSDVVKKGEIDALDKTLLPYCIFKQSDDGWVEIPRLA